VKHTAVVADPRDNVVAAPVTPFQKPFFDQVQDVLVDGADGGVSNAIGDVFECGTPLFCLSKMLDELEDFLLAAGEVCCVHTPIIEKIRIFVKKFSFF